MLALQAEFGAAVYMHTLGDVQFKPELDFEKNTARVSVCVCVCVCVIFLCVWLPSCACLLAYYLIFDSYCQIGR